MKIFFLLGLLYANVFTLPNYSPLKSPSALVERQPVVLKAASGPPRDQQNPTTSGSAAAVQLLGQQPQNLASSANTATDQGQKVNFLPTKSLVPFETGMSEHSGPWTGTFRPTRDFLDNFSSSINVPKLTGNNIGSTPKDNSNTAAATEKIKQQHAQRLKHEASDIDTGKLPSLDQIKAIKDLGFKPIPATGSLISVGSLGLPNLEPGKPLDEITYIFTITATNPGTAILYSDDWLFDVCEVVFKAGELTRTIKAGIISRSNIETTVNTMELYISFQSQVSPQQDTMAEIVRYKTNLVVPIWQTDKVCTINGDPHYTQFHNPGETLLQFGFHGTGWFDVIKGDYVHLQVYQVKCTGNDATCIERVSLSVGGEIYSMGFSDMMAISSTNPFKPLKSALGKLMFVRVDGATNVGSEPSIGEVYFVLYSIQQKAISISFYTTVVKNTRYISMTVKLNPIFKNGIDGKTGVCGSWENAPMTVFKPRSVDVLDSHWSAITDKPQLIESKEYRAMKVQRHKDVPLENLPLCGLAYHKEPIPIQEKPQVVVQKKAEKVQVPAPILSVTDNRATVTKTVENRGQRNQVVTTVRHEFITEITATQRIQPPGYICSLENHQKLGPRPADIKLPQKETQPPAPALTADQLAYAKSQCKYMLQPIATCSVNLKSLIDTCELYIDYGLDIYIVYSMHRVQYMHTCGLELFRRSKEVESPLVIETKQAIEKHGFDQPRPDECQVWLPYGGCQQCKEPANYSLIGTKCVKNTPQIQQIYQAQPTYFKLVVIQDYYKDPTTSPLLTMIDQDRFPEFVQSVNNPVSITVSQSSSNTQYAPKIDGQILPAPFVGVSLKSGVASGGPAINGGPAPAISPSGQGPSNSGKSYTDSTPSVFAMATGSNDECCEIDLTPTHCKLIRMSGSDSVLECIVQVIR